MTQHHSSRLWQTSESSLLFTRLQGILHSFQSQLHWLGILVPQVFTNHVTWKPRHQSYVRCAQAWCHSAIIPWSTILMLSISPVSKDSTPLDKNIPCFILNYQPLTHFSIIFKFELHRLGIHVPQAFTNHVQIYSQMISQFFWHVALFFLQCRVISLLGQSTPTANSTTQIWRAISRSSGNWGDHHWSGDKLLLWNNSS